MKISFLFAASAAGLVFAQGAQAQLSWSNLYGMASVSYSELRRDTPANPLVALDGGSDIGVNLGLGYQFHRKLGVEVSRHDLGTARITDAGAGGPAYSNQAVRATVVAVKFTPWTEQTFMPFLKLGNARLQVSLADTAGTVVRSSRDQIYGAFGVDYLVMPKVKLGLMYEHFGRTANDPAPAAGQPPRLSPQTLSLSSSISF